MNKSAPFPQANDFQKVISIINIDDDEKLKDYGYMCIYLGEISPRQVDYYISACIYIGLLDEHKAFTELGQRLHQMGTTDKMAELARYIISDEIFGTVYFRQKLLGFDLETEDVVDIMKEYIVFESEAMYKRRASTVLSWVRWLYKNVG